MREAAGTATAEAGWSWCRGERKRQARRRGPRLVGWDGEMAWRRAVVSAPLMSRLASVSWKESETG